MPRPLHARAFVLLLATLFVAHAARPDGEYRWGFTVASTSMLPSIDSAPVADSDGFIYFGVSLKTTNPSGFLAALSRDANTKNGFHWTFQTGDEVVASPALVGDTLYFGVMDGKVYAVDKRNGGKRWEGDLGATLGTASTSVATTPAVSRDGSVLYFGATDYSLDIGALVAVSAADGRVIWSRPIDESLDSSPVVAADGTVYVGGSRTVSGHATGTLYAFRPDGSPRWEYPLHGWVFGSPALGGDGTIYVGSTGNRFVALTADGTPKWEVALTSNGSAAVGPDGTVYVGNWLDSQLYALDRKTGQTKWVQVGQPATGSAPTVRADGTVLFGGTDGVLRAYDADKGTIKWSVNLRTRTGNGYEEIWSAPVIAPTADHDIYVGSSYGVMHAIRGNEYDLSQYASWPTFQHDSSRTGRAGERVMGGWLKNLTTRGLVQPGRPLIGGFVVQGDGSKSMLVRAVGPTLGNFGVSSPQPDPSVTVYRGTNFFLPPNDNWDEGEDVGRVAALVPVVGAFPLPAGSKDAALVADTLVGQTYSAHVDTRVGQPGIALFELYDGAPNSPGATLANISTRGFVGTGEQVLIAGLFLGGQGRIRALVRAVGPSLATAGVSGVLQRPVITVHADGQFLMRKSGWWDDSWRGDYVAAAKLVGAFPLINGSTDTVMILSLSPEVAYTFQVSGADGTTGEALVEVYALPF